MALPLGLLLGLLLPLALLLGPVLHLPLVQVKPLVLLLVLPLL